MEDHLRLLLGERIPPGGTDADTFFTDPDIIDLLDTYGDINAAAAAGWRGKAAEYAKYIDIEESGSTRKMSQMYRQAELQANYFGKLASGSVEERLQAARGGIIARTSNWLHPRDDSERARRA